MVSVFKLAQVIPQRVCPPIQPLEHAPPEQTGVPPVHVVPQAPQCIALDRSCSQPLVALESQLPQPALHAPKRHTPAMQVAAARLNMHVVPQAPQLLGSELVSTQRPEHSAPVAQRHAPATQLWSARHEVPQAPQLLRSVLVSTQRPPHSIPLVHRHEPPVHCWSARHDRPHIPQWDAEVCVSTQAIPHKVCAPVHALEHIPVIASHRGVAPEHALLHRPQWAVDESDASHPLAALLSQSAKPAAHVYMQPLVASHVLVALARAGHALSHPPAPSARASLLASIELSTPASVELGASIAPSRGEGTSGALSTSVSNGVTGTSGTTQLASSPHVCPRDSQRVESVQAMLPAGQPVAAVVVHATGMYTRAIPRRLGMKLKRTLRVSKTGVPLARDAVSSMRISAAPSRASLPAGTTLKLDGSGRTDATPSRGNTTCSRSCSREVGSSSLMRSCVMRDGGASVSITTTTCVEGETHETFSATIAGTNRATRVINDACLRGGGLCIRSRERTSGAQRSVAEGVAGGDVGCGHSALKPRYALL